MFFLLKTIRSAPLCLSRCLHYVNKNPLLHIFQKCLWYPKRSHILNVCLTSWYNGYVQPMTLFPSLAWTQIWDHCIVCFFIIPHIGSHNSCCNWIWLTLVAHDCQVTDSHGITELSIGLRLMIVFFFFFLYKASWRILQCPLSNILPCSNGFSSQRSKCPFLILRAYPVLPLGDN